MSFLDRLQSLDVAQNTRRHVTPKHQLPSPVVERRQRKATAQAREEACKAAVWDRDGGCSRASGKPVLKASPNPAVRGEVAHLKARSTSPAKKYDPANTVLLTAEEHQLSDARTAGGRCLLEIVGTSADGPLTFTRRDRKGRVLWTRTTEPVHPATARKVRR